MAVPSVRRDTKVCRIDTGRARGWQFHIHRDEMLAAALISLRRARSHFSQPDSSLTACGQ